MARWFFPYGGKAGASPMRGAPALAAQRLVVRAELIGSPRP